jgi:hypothetical protein
MRFAIQLASGIFLALLVGASAETTDDSLRIYAVNIVQHPEQSWTGYGIYLGQGLIITAAHVVGRASRGAKRADRGLGSACVGHQGRGLRAIDLTLMSIDEQRLPINLRMRRMPLCEKPPWVGQPVIVAIPETTARSRIMSPMLIPDNLGARFSTLISDVASTGNSGSGVFDAGQKCLLGIMSRKIQSRSNGGNKARDIAKYFEPASRIRTFIPADYHF